jgi:pullulanase/glycogen debranching enzyme
MVKAFHKEGIAVLMDVVYNHVSQYDYNPLKYIDKFYYFRLEEDCLFTSVSGCGNDLKTERPMTRRLIVDSVIHWMKEYQIDGFRFDLAKLIDWQTIDAIREEALQVNPDVILIAEPWGGGYDPAGFSDHGWAAWNDQIRNGVKGQNPHDGRGFIFGEWQGENDVNSLRRYLTGSLRENGGQYIKTSHSINYLESHDDHTMGDFIRLGLGDVTEDQIIQDLKKHITLTPTQLKLNKLAALFLFVSQGPIMIHEGQEYARSKVIAPTLVPDPAVGKIDHDSYNKDNETNWLNFDHAELNRELVNYYKGLIALRQAHPAFRRAKPSDYQFLETTDSHFISLQLVYDGKEYLAFLNGNRLSDQEIELPGGEWAILADGEQADAKPLSKTKDRFLKLESRSGIVLVKE